MNVIGRPIGFFDSGVGGISVLREAIELMPYEDYIYFGDSKNAPYGTKTVNEVRELSFKAAQFLVDRKAKALVVACNTATSSSINYLREIYKDMPVIGIEPALKPAVELNEQGKIVIMGTPITLAEAKFQRLLRKYENEADLIVLPCPGLAEMIELGFTEGKKIEDYLHNKLNKISYQQISTIVLGCTHYPFIENSIRKVVGNNITIIDGGMGTAKQLKRQLKKYDLENVKTNIGKVQIYNSNESIDTIEFCKKLIKK